MRPTYEEANESAAVAGFQNQVKQVETLTGKVVTLNRVLEEACGRVEQLLKQLSQV